MKPSEHLTKARDILRPEGAWTQGQAWGDANGDQCRVEQARRFCSLEALSVVFSRAESRAADFLRRAIEQGSIILWNDAPNRTQAEVLETFAKAIALAEAEGQ